MLFYEKTIDANSQHQQGPMTDDVELADVEEVEEENEEDDEEAASRSLLDDSNGNNSAEYDKVLEEVNASIRYNQRANIQGGNKHNNSRKNMSREGSHSTLSSLRNDSRTNIEEMAGKGATKKTPLIETR